jgi:hypothetical protein
MEKSLLVKQRRSGLVSFARRWLHEESIVDGYIKLHFTKIADPNYLGRGHRRGVGKLNVGDRPVIPD